MKEFNEKLLECMLIGKYRTEIKKLFEQVPEEFEDFIIDYGFKIPNQTPQCEKAEIFSRLINQFMSSLGKFCNRIEK